MFEIAALSKFVKVIAPALKWIAIGGGVLLVAWFLWGKIEAHFDDYNTLIANEAKLKAAEISNLEVVRGLNSQIELLSKDNQEKQAVLARQQQRIEKANEYKDNVEEILAKHRLDKLIAAKPGLVEGVFNRGTDDLFRMLEQNSRAVSDYYASPDRDLSPTIIYSAPKTAKPPSR